MKECPKCKSTEGYFYKNMGSYDEVHSFDSTDPIDKNLTVSRCGERAFCLECKRRIEDLDRNKETKKKEYYLVTVDDRITGIIPKSHQQKIRDIRNLAGIKLTKATQEEIKQKTNLDRLLK